MNTKQRFKLGAGAGLVTMLLGALMVLAPGAGAAQLDPVPIDANTCPQDGYDPGTVKIDAGDVPSVFVEAPDGYLIDGYCVKTGSESSGDGPLWIEFDPPVTSTTITYPGKDTISHYAVSYVRAGRISVAKAVTGAGAPGAETEFELTVDCGDADLNGPADGTDAVFTLAAGETAWVSPSVAAGTVCTVTETDDQGATTVTYSVVDGEVTVVGGETSPVVVTNDFPGTSPTYSVTLQKLAESDDANADFSDLEAAVADGSAVEFELTITNTGTGALVVESLVDVYEGADGADVEIDLLAAGVLGCEREGDTVDLADGLPGLSETVCTFTLEGYARAGDSITNVVTLETDQAGVVDDDATVSTPEVASAGTGTITVVKQVNEGAPAAWAFDFEGSLGALELTDGVSSTGERSVDAGDHTIAEDISELPAGWEFDEASCIDQSGAVLGEAGADGSVDFTVAPNADVTCTFVNEYRPPTVQPAAEVKGVQTVRSLPRTGDGTGALAGVGAFMLALGAAMVIGSRRQLARR